MAFHEPFGYLQHKLWSKERPGVKLAFWLRPLKVGNWPDFLAWRQRATYRWKALNKGYNFALDLITIEGLHKKLCALKVARILVVAISRLPLGSPETKKVIWMWPLWRGAKYTIWGKVMASPESGLWWVLWVQNRPCL
jgi:hypothetical protein